MEINPLAMLGALIACFCPVLLIAYLADQAIIRRKRTRKLDSIRNRRTRRGGA